MIDDRDPFFIGWSPTISRIDRRFVLGAGLALLTSGGALGAALAAAHGPPGDGAWPQSDIATWTGVLLADPFPLLRTRHADGQPRTLLLATQGKTGVRLPGKLIGGPVSVTGSLISRGRSAMIAVADGGGFAPLVAGASDLLAAAQAPDWAPQDMGETRRLGEILDAKCWLGAMRPGHGKTHKACAALCATGGLPLAFCEPGACDAGGGGDAPLFLDDQGRPHGPWLAAFVADPVIAAGRLVKVGDMTQLRVSRTAMMRV